MGTGDEGRTAEAGTECSFGGAPPRARLAPGPRCALRARRSLRSVGRGGAPPAGFLPHRFRNERG